MKTPRKRTLNGADAHGPIINGQFRVKAHRASIRRFQQMREILPQFSGLGRGNAADIGLVRISCRIVEVVGFGRVEDLAGFDGGRYRGQENTGIAELPDIGPH